MKYEDFEFRLDDEEYFEILQSVWNRKARTLNSVESTFLNAVLNRCSECYGAGRGLDGEAGLFKSMMDEELNSLVDRDYQKREAAINGMSDAIYLAIQLPWAGGAQESFSESFTEIAACYAIDEPHVTFFNLSATLVEELCATAAVSETIISRLYN